MAIGIEAGKEQQDRVVEDRAGLTRLKCSPELGGREVINIVLAHEERLPEGAG